MTRKSTRSSLPQVKNKRGSTFSRLIGLPGRVPQVSLLGDALVQAVFPAAFPLLVACVLQARVHGSFQRSQEKKEV